MFITLEGLDGAGKSTQIERLKHRFEECGRTVVCTREPGGTETGDQLRELLLNNQHAQIGSRTEALLYAASRAQLVAEVIRPALARGEIVLCDRFVDASLAYQGAGLGLGVEAVAAINRFATEGLEPDLTFLFDLPVDASQSRVQAARAGTGLDRIERRSTDYFERVRAEFLAIAARHPQRVVVLAATRTADELEQEIWRTVQKRLMNSDTR